MAKERYWAARDRRDYLFLKAQRPDVFINFAYESLMPSPVSRAGYVCMFPPALTRKVGLRQASERLARHMGLPSGSEAVRSYPRIFANSAFTGRWVNRLWGRPVDGYLHPPCDDFLDHEVEKERRILSVGRFFPWSSEPHHHKRHDVMIEAFRHMDDLHSQGWELELIGTVAPVPQHQAWVEHLQDLAGGAPVRIRTDVSHRELRLAVAQASLYWHATGFGTDAEIHPVSQEHFGIAVVEAMGAGAVPIVHGSGGPAEIVQSGRDGYHWSTPDQLIERSRAVVRNPQLRGQIAQAARRRYLDFSPAAFAAEAEALLDSILEVPA
jgi:Glycosyltransferase